MLVITEFRPIPFDEWMNNIAPDIDENTRVLLIECWNASLFQACELFGEHEGTDHGVEDILKVK